MLDTQVGGRGWHFGDGPFTDAHEVDTAWVDAHPIDDAPWQKKMVLADYNAYAFREPTLQFDQGQLIEYVHPASAEAVTFQPMQLQWTNDLDQISAVADPQAVAATINDDMLTWVDAYGSGIDFQWETQTARLMKYVNIASLADLGAPPQFIIDGGNPVLRVELLFQKSANTETWVDGVLWDEKANNPQETLNHVEFRLAGEPLWWFKAPKAWNSNSGEPGNTINPTMRLRKSAQNLFVEILTPWSWLETSIYPVTIDVVVDEQISGTTYDGMEEADTTWHEDGYDSDGIGLGGALGGSADLDAGLVFTSVAVTQGSTIDTAYVQLYGTWESMADDVDLITAGFDEDNTAVFASDGSDRPSTRAQTTATVSESWTAAQWDYNWNTLAEIKTVIEEITDRGSFSSGNNIGVVIKDDNNAVQDRIQAHDYTTDSGNAAKLHIEYTAAGGDTLNGTATLAGVGSLTADADKVAAANATLAGVGSLTAAGENTRFGTSTLAGVGSLTAAGENTRLGTATLSGVGSLAAVGAGEFIGTATLSGVGALAAVGTRISGAEKGTATLSGVGSLAAAGENTRYVATTLAGVGTLQATGTTFTIYSGTATLSGIGTLQAIGPSLPAAPVKRGAPGKKEKKPWLAEDFWYNKREERAEEIAATEIQSAKAVEAEYKRAAVERQYGLDDKFKERVLKEDVDLQLAGEEGERLFKRQFTRPSGSPFKAAAMRRSEDSAAGRQASAKKQELLFAGREKIVAERAAIKQSAIQDVRLKNLKKARSAQKRKKKKETKRADEIKKARLKNLKKARAAKKRKKR